MIDKAFSQDSTFSRSQLGNVGDCNIQWDFNECLLKMNKG
jgi:hypothetical protein